MRRKTKGMIALASAVILCLSMSVSALAAGGSTGDEDIPQINIGLGKDNAGNDFAVVADEVAQNVKDVLKDENKVKDILKDAGFDVKDDNKVVVIGAGNFQAVDADDLINHDTLTSVEFPEGGADVEFYLGENAAENLKDLANGNTIYVLHQKADGTWEVIEGKVRIDADGAVIVTARLNSLSPIAFIKVMSNGKVVVLDKANKPVAALAGDELNVTRATVKTSPKTGE